MHVLIIRPNKAYNSSIIIAQEGRPRKLLSLAQEKVKVEILPIENYPSRPKHRNNPTFFAYFLEIPYLAFPRYYPITLVA